MSEQSTQRNLFTPFQLGPYELPNRLVMAPMTRNRAGEGLTATARTAEYYAQRADAGLLVTEGSQVSPQGVGYPNTPGIHTEAQVAAWRAVTDAVHARGGRIYLQLWHVGRVSHPSLQPDGALPVAPSAVGFEGQAFTYEGLKDFVTPRALETEEIPGIVADFERGARNAYAAGFDGVELHGANGYLIDQFLRDGTNHRTDRYGGTVQNRVRFLLEVAEAVAGVWGPERVGVRFSPTGTYNGMSDSDPATVFGLATSELSRMRIGYVHVSEPPETEGRVAPVLRAVFQGAFIANGGYLADTANAAIARGEADLVAFGVPYLANPDLARRFREGAPLNEADRATFYGGDERGYTDYPTLDALAAR